ncbi:MAG: hypothetical protein A2508_03855 [Candidatus Lambdaproteobacteria bacterium RIFOXYD12_FULL_49_8]|uniref:Uncharacterized protein n=1 Tax=Candidatus Lambdaproteobacteria bacterium RIFOXYD2_FULL_50_16 TaxID=1817772 RepID=A0A1F6GBG5_9PROT|nr:MAG: hypothetical protein A2527_07040 [Candidatus Lambdaproteobacteria bacterium RIFOXYD2_FULL_50_16]OGG97736.1 MAG: hypothetical protein A2508_03855 [Candidatus Lambdaproteobacteria bacterium RIFOXYD12_FULL_49_8]
MSFLKKLLILGLLLALLVPNQPLLAQMSASGGGGTAMGDGVGGPNPPMRNVFLNVLWGSLTGGMLYTGLNILDDTKSKGERYGFTNMTAKFIEGATYGGIGGLFVGVYLSMSGISFDPNRTRVVGGEDFRPIHWRGPGEVELAHFHYHF